ncbi:MAG: glucosyltransferase domain-containing protein [Lachnospiraceae bacterium]|nr:glucosyltransferase domain-containing protein [Lachnospiraceae bacterium]
MAASDRRKTYICVWILCFLYVLPLIIANRYVYDDTQRVFYHTAGWALDGRPLTELLIKLLCGANQFIYDIFPLPLLLSVTAYAAVSVRWCEDYFLRFGATAVITAFLPFSMPLFLANLSYRFDCIGFTASVVLLMIPFIYRKNVWWKGILAGIACVLASMCFYQPTVGLFAGLAVLTAYGSYLRKEQFLKRLAGDAASFVSGTAVYKLVVSEIFVDRQDWRADAKNFALSSDMIGNAGLKIKLILQLLERFARSVGARQLLLYAAIWILGGIAVIYCLKERKRAQAAIGIAAFCVLPVLLPLAAVLPMMALSASYALPRQQTALMAVMFLLAGCLAAASQRFPRAALCLGVLTVLFHFSFSYAYGNLMREQKEYEEMIVYGIICDIDDNVSSEIDNIAVEGEIPFSPVVESTCRIMPVFADMVPEGFDGDGMLGGAIINHYSRDIFSIVDITVADRQFMDENEPFAKSREYELYLNGGRICVRFTD